MFGDGLLNYVKLCYELFCTGSAKRAIGATAVGCTNIGANFGSRACRTGGAVTTWSRTPLGNALVALFAIGSSGQPLRSM